MNHGLFWESIQETAHLNQLLTVWELISVFTCVDYTTQASVG